MKVIMAMMEVVCECGYQCPKKMDMPISEYAAIAERSLLVIFNECEAPPSGALVEVREGYSLYQPVTR